MRFPTSIMSTGSVEAIRKCDIESGDCLIVRNAEWGWGVFQS